MRILVLSNLYPPNALGGYEMSCRDVVDRWRERGHEVLVLTTSSTVTGVVEPADRQPHVRRGLEWYWTDHAFHRPPLLERLALERRNHAALRQAIDGLRPDVASVWHMGGMPLSLLTALESAGVPLVLNVCDDWPVYGPRADAWLSAWARLPAPVRVLGAAAAGVPTSLPDLDRHRSSFVSDFTLRQVRSRSRWAFPGAVVVGSGIDRRDFPPREAKPRPWGGRLLGVGRLEPRKGFDTVVAALPQLPDVTLELVGVPHPEHLSELERQADGLGVRDRLTVGAVPRAELAARYAQADAVVFPSRWDEPFGLVPLEAMSQATPVVATRRGGSAEYLRDGHNCLEVPPDDPTAVADAVRRLAGDAGLRDHLVRGGLETAERFSVDRLADLLEPLHTAGPAPTPATVPVVDSATSSSWGGPSRAAVVVSTHGRSGYLRGLLQALDAQTAAGFEVVVVDNGSPDETWQVLSTWAARTTLPALVMRVAFCDGPAVPRNTAVARTTAPVLAFTDDDCLPARGWLDALLPALADPGIAAVQGRTHPEAGGWGGPWRRSLTVETVTGLCETANLACRRADFLAAGGFPSRRLLTGRAFGEDVLLGAALARRGDVVLREDAVVEHRVLPGSYRDFLRERHRLGGFPLLARAVPELRSRVFAGVFLSRQTAVVDLGVAAVTTAALTRRPAVALAALPWAVASWRTAAGRPGRPRAVRAAQVAAGDAVGLAGLVEGSARARRLLL